MTGSPRTLRRWLAVAVAVAGTVAIMFGVPHRVSEIPDRTVVLTFDDGLRSHLDLVAPLLKEYGFGATFFITGQWRNDWESHLAFEELVAIQEMGFEIGSHSFSHSSFGDPQMVEYVGRDLDQLDAMLKRAGVARPRSFAWPAGCFGPEARAILPSRGIRFARRGMSPEARLGSPGHGALYDPGENDPLLIPTTLTVGPGTTVEDLRAAIAGARDGRAAVLQFHGVPDPVNEAVSTDPVVFRRFLDLLRDEGCKVIALRDLEKWVSPEVHPDDDLLRVRLD